MKEIGATLGVSESTTSRDLMMPVEEGIVRRSYGDATTLERTIRPKALRWPTCLRRRDRMLPDRWRASSEKEERWSA